jgi:hypothetical protein
MSIRHESVTIQFPAVPMNFASLHIQNDANGCLIFEKARKVIERATSEKEL